VGRAPPGSPVFVVIRSVRRLQEMSAHDERINRPYSAGERLRPSMAGSGKKKFRRLLPLTLVSPAEVREVKESKPPLPRLRNTHISIGAPVVVFPHPV